MIWRYKISKLIFIVYKAVKGGLADPAGSPDLEAAHELGFEG